MRPSRNIGPIVDARPADTSPPFMAGEDVHEVQLRPVGMSRGFYAGDQ